MYIIKALCILSTLSLAFGYDAYTTKACDDSVTELYISTRISCTDLATCESTCRTECDNHASCLSFTIFDDFTCQRYRSCIWIDKTANILKSEVRTDFSGTVYEVYPGYTCSVETILTSETGRNPGACQSACDSYGACVKSFNLDYLTGYAPPNQCNVFDDSDCTALVEDINSMLYLDKVLPIPTDAPTGSPTTGSTNAPTGSPTTLAPTDSPTTPAPTGSPTTSAPTGSPTTKAPTGSPTSSPTVTGGCTSSNQCTGNEICNGSVCAEISCNDNHGSCYGHYLPGRLPYCDFESNFCVDNYASDCANVADCETEAKTKRLVVDALYSYQKSIKVTNSEKRKNITIELAQEAIDTNPENIFVKVSGSETFSMDNGVLQTIGDNDAALASICSMRCGSMANLCTCELVESGRRRLQVQISVTISIVWDLEYDAYLELENSGTDFGNANLTNELAAFLGVDPEDVIVYSSDGTVKLDVVVIDESGEENLDLINDLTSSETAVNDLTTTLASELEIDPADIESTNIDLCGDRDCNQRGTCNPTTGTCDCVGDWWGINCQEACVCSNGGTCRNAYCQCLFPYYDQRCNSIAELGPVNT
jgi:hypothetical protein